MGDENGKQQLYMSQENIQGEEKNDELLQLS
jgi:hypothetical protein